LAAPARYPIYELPIALDPTPYVDLSLIEAAGKRLK
jgi:hypothetical protein